MRAANAAAPVGAADVDRELADPLVAAALRVGVGDGVADHLAGAVDDRHEDVGAFEPGQDF
jgi:hypothetical protein